ncbi:MAG TPA: hypothetical protein VFE33_10845 [Thermoanaerobaculia bacterium]|nr:hypothetical protein [Thermoanaerobaculia bacterium]
MSPDPRPSLPRRPTLVIGYGAFGLDVLRRLLASAAPRGVLAWREPRGGASPSERQLEDLALVWVRDRFGLAGQEVDEEDAREGSAIEMMRDLYRQIRRCGEGRTAESDLAGELAAAARELLSASARAGRDELPLGLDVVVLARPTGPEVVGLLDHLLSGAMDELANNANLERSVQGSEPLAFTAVFDFENYWDRGETAHRTRRALSASVERWQKRRSDRKPGFGRVYLVDGRTGDGFRDDAHRLDEITLFLELMLFEGQRDGVLGRLYQSPGFHESPVATFGVRLFERSTGLLARLAAARFGIGWLDYLAGRRPFQPEAQSQELRRCLAPFVPPALDTLLGVPTLRAHLAAELAALEGELIALPVDDDAWAERVGHRYEEFLDAAEQRLARIARERQVEIGREQLAGLAGRLETALEADLHHPRQPVPLGTVLSELEEAWSALEGTSWPVETAGEEAGDSTPLRAPRTGETHTAYRRFADRRVSARGLRSWWPLFALTLALGLTPVATDLLGDLPALSPHAAFWRTQLHALAIWLQSRPAVLAPLFAVATWALAGMPLQRGIARRLERAGRFFTDGERGRLVDRLRADLAPGGALRRAAERRLSGLLDDLRLAVATEVGHELGRLVTRLRDRRQEMTWLRDQLRAFLGLHGLSTEDDPDLLGLIRDDTGIRHGVERGEDFARMLERNPPTPERFLSLQAEAAPFTGWADKYSDAFLYSLAFIDRLSRIYRDPLEEELARPDAGPRQSARAEELLAFLAGKGTFDLALGFKAQEGVPPDRRYALLPAGWRRLPGVLAALADLRMSGEQQVLDGTDGARAYLLRLQLGVAPSCLVEAAE